MTLNSYEAMVILEPNVPDPEVEGLIKSLEGELVTSGGTIAVREIQGKRPLAYKIKGHREGIYALLNFQVPSEGVKKLEKKFKLTPQVLRYLLIKNS